MKTRRFFALVLLTAPLILGWAARARAEEGGGGLPQFDVAHYPGQIFWLLLVFAFMYFFFANRTLPTLSRIIEGRREHVQSDLDAANRFNAEAESVLKTYEDSLGKAKEQASGMVASTLSDSRQSVEKALSDFRSRADEEIDALDARVIRTRESAAVHIETAAAEAAILVLEKVSGLREDVGRARALIDDLGKKVRAA